MNSKEDIRKLVRETLLNEAPPGGMFGNFKFLKKRKMSSGKDVNKYTENINSWYEHPAFDRDKTLDKTNEMFVNKEFEKVVSIILDRYQGSDKDSFSEKIEEIVKEYKKLMKRGFEDVVGRNNALSAKVIKDLSELSKKTYKLLNKKNPSSVNNNFVKSWLQLKK